VGILSQPFPEKDVPALSFHATLWTECSLFSAVPFVFGSVGQWRLLVACSVLMAYALCHCHSYQHPCNTGLQIILNSLTEN
jgi:hypothetical protein